MLLVICYWSIINSYSSLTPPAPPAPPTPHSPLPTPEFK
ncbi:hypothetical protein COO91_07196 [Nostoc flagelliforme CCNUN1]|uniref:Uncharacterized protein n=1 Tax=Nostoc flagelliforme CCNUN1 TaxID=2038116 RepID=A0A2K8T0E5_9NOSO|nr:hypothetical protein COO91_07196 [Nostoc flagelliforme CCNUN1]